MLTVRAADLAGSEAAVVRQINDTEGFLRVPLGNLEVLVETRKDLERYSAVLRRAGASYVHLRDYDGASSDHVKIGGSSGQGTRVQLRIVARSHQLPGACAARWVRRFVPRTDGAGTARADVGMTRARRVMAGYVVD